MASNDMNSWDKDPDELLRRRWQQVFDDFEVQPQPSLSRRILDPLTAGRRRSPGRWLAGAGLLLLIGAGFTSIIRLRKYSDPTVSNSLITHRTHTPVRPEVAGRIRQLTTPSKQFTVPELPAADSSTNSPADHRPSTNRQSVNFSSITSSGVRNPAILTDADEGRIRPSSERHSRATSVAVGQPTVLAGHGATTHFSTPPSDPTKTVTFSPDPTPTYNVTRLTSDNVTSSTPSAIAAKNSDAAQTVALERLKTPGVALLPSSLRALPVQLSASALAAVPPSEATVIRQRRQWFIEVVPLSSFQWMSVPPMATAYLSQVDAPEAFSPSTWGYQLNGGIRWKRWQAYLSVGQLRRWAYYTVNENRYRVEPSVADPHQLVRETYAVAENVLLPLVGVGLNRETLLAQGRYAVELGGQASYLPTIGHPLLGLRAGAGRRLALNRHLEGRVGLTAEYGLNRLLSEQQQLSIHPLMVGFRLRLQPR